MYENGIATHSQTMTWIKFVAAALSRPGGQGPGLSRAQPREG